MEMLLAIDIGNTNITIGLFNGEKLQTTWRVVSSIHRMPDEYEALLSIFFGQKNIRASDVKGAIICSVVPPLTGTFDEMCRQYLRVNPLIVGAGVKTGIKILMDNPREVGADRVVNSVAAYYTYGGPSIVIDMGTATTFDAISANGEYLGGAIAPGIVIAAEALFTRTAALPRVDLVQPKHAIGTNTVAAMQSGIVYGCAGLIEYVVSKIKTELGGTVKVIATGGHSRLMSKLTSAIDTVDLDITLVGLRMIYDMNRPRD